MESENVLNTVETFSDEIRSEYKNTSDNEEFKNKNSVVIMIYLQITPLHDE